jgi:hypothetical protein
MILSAKVAVAFFGPSGRLREPSPPLSFMVPPTVVWFSFLFFFLPVAMILLAVAALQHKLTNLISLQR